MAEWSKAQDLGSCLARGAGSIPVPGSGFDTGSDVLTPSNYGNTLEDPGHTRAGDELGELDDPSAHGGGERRLNQGMA